METGWLYLVVGPSGAGKDTLLDAARQRFSNTTSVIFPRRSITRPANAGGENHLGLSVEEFTRKKRAGIFALSWDAHDLKYGIPRSINDELSEGKCVVVNVSRSVLNEARSEYPNLRIISITVDPDILSRRLHARGRESEADIQKRLERAKSYRVRGDDVIEIDNSGSLEEAISNFVIAIENPYLQTNHPYLYTESPTLRGQ
ncbi:hypothetical protein WH95_11420 [Kiloniella litopenaei]|uniref:Ribose 1,5-bisphosphate phosphokinase PhnN n=1 Tax=Kiloniella litopenaei TaxID=1549748 RepID=A0A0M2R4G4_9PROT|nr:phosphonate metabolism protein/1,5-bisphosphokinase (PRPP-forming) PhnN [Kiloniella litopenaei]KKJ76737.1 hypothetical protein WH95_11420 [Kiloniella litopenaei]